MTTREEISHLSDIPLEITVELDRKQMTIRQILELAPGSVIKMGRSAGDNIDILVGGTMLGSGEIVIIEDVAGVRFTDFQEQE